MKIQCEAKTMSVDARYSNITKTARKSEQLLINQSNLLEKINKYRNDQKSNLKFQDYISDKLLYRDTRISQYKISPQVSNLREFSKQELLNLRENYSRIAKKEFNITTDLESYSRMFNESVRNGLPSIEMMAKVQTSRRVSQIEGKGKDDQSTKQSIRTSSGKLSVNSCAKQLVAKVETQRYSTKKMIKSNSVKIRRPKKDKKEEPLGFKDLIVLEAFDTSPLSQNIVKDPEILKVKAKSITILSQNSFLFNMNSSVEREMASLTKIMTCYMSLVLIKIHEIDIKTTVKVSRTASELGGTTAEFRAGDMVSYEDLLYGVMLPSGNDAAFTLAEHIGKVVYLRSPQFQKIKEQAKEKLKSKIVLTEQDCQKRFSPNTHKSIDSFISKMNQLASYLKLTNTSFSNSHGLSDINNKSSSRDISILCHYALKNPTFRKIVRTKSYTCSTVNLYTKAIREIEWENTNKLLQLAECTGIKTGVTGTAGPCMAASFLKGGREYIVVILKTTCVNSRFLEAKTLFQIGYRHWRKQELLELEESRRKIEKEKSDENVEQGKQ